MVQPSKEPVSENPCEFVDDPQLRAKIASAVPEIQQYIANLCKRVRDLAKIGAALSAEHNLPKLLQMILEEARYFTNADGGTLYMMDEDGHALKFEIVQTDSLNIRMGGLQVIPSTGILCDFTYRMASPIMPWFRRMSA